MSEQESRLEDVAFLARSTHRVQLLEAVGQDGPTTRSELRERVDGSRTTVGRNLEALVDRGWIRKRGNYYRIAPSGRMIVRAFGDLEETIATANRLEPVLEWLPVSELDLDLRHLRDAEVETPSPGNPWAMVNRHVEALESASSIRAVLPVTAMRPYEEIRRTVVEEGGTATVVARPAVTETLTADPDYAPVTEELLAADGFELRTVDRAVPFYLGLLDDRVEVGVDDDGEPKALLGSSDDEVREWAERTFATYYEEARPYRASSEGRRSRIADGE